MWPYDDYPLWLQGMVYVLSPSHTAELFQAALRTGYMHTDDVFIGICVNKTARTGQQTIIDDISSYEEPDRGESQRKVWDAAVVPFFHLPDHRLYIKWHYDAVEKSTSEPTLGHHKYRYALWFLLDVIAIVLLLICVCKFLFYTCRNRHNFCHIAKISRRANYQKVL